MNAIIQNMPSHAADEAEPPFVSLPERLLQLTREAPEQVLVTDRHGSWDRRTLLRQAHRIAQALLQQGLQQGDTVAALAANSRELVALMVGTLAAGGCFVPLSGMSTDDTLLMMLEDSDARFLFCDPDQAARMPALPTGVQPLLLQGERSGWTGMDTWLEGHSDQAPAVTLSPEDAFNIIYSSGTTGRPKGIVHDHRLRARQIGRFQRMGFDAGCTTLLATPIYSNTTMVALLPTLHGGGHLVLMDRFSADGYLDLAVRHRVTHTMLVPVQYQRLLAAPEFEHTDLSGFKVKMSAGAPLRAHLIRELMARWPGKLIEIYGMTEGGGGTVLDCGAFPDKWDSVGRPGEGSQLHVIDDQGRVLPPGMVGELVGRGGTMMRGYYKREDLSEDMIWRDGQGQVFYRTGDMARIDEDGFVFLLDRRKDMILSGGFNIFAEDLEKVLLGHDQVLDAAVIAVPSETWGETPLGLVIRQPGATVTAAELLEWANGRLGKTQRLSAIEFRDAFPRNALGKIMKRELRTPYWTDQD